MKYPNKYYERLKESAKIGGMNCWIISNQIFENFPQFEYWSGSGKPIHHHYGDGGLARHTMEVIDLMVSSSKTLDYPNSLSYDKMFLSGLFHDVGKLWDYEKKQKAFSSPWGGSFAEVWDKTKHARNIHHISRSALVWSKAVDATKLYKDEHDEILHAILAHHGQREWGSPVAPNSKLAWLLHLCDGISARMDDCEKYDRIEQNYDKLLQET